MKRGGGASDAIRDLDRDPPIRGRNGPAELFAGDREIELPRSNSNSN